MSKSNESYLQREILHVASAILRSLAQAKPTGVTMRVYLRLLLLSASIAGAAYLASQLFVPDALPVADSEQPQWYLQLAFVLRSIELIGLGGMALVLIAGLSAWLTRRSATTR
jgi:hypothetical protein